MLRAKIMTIIIVNIYTIRYGFTNKIFAEKVYQVLEIKLQYLTKPKQISRFNNRVIKPITYAIYPILFISTYIKSFALLLITKVKNHLLIFC